MSTPHVHSYVAGTLIVGFIDSVMSLALGCYCAYNVPRPGSNPRLRLSLPAATTDGRQFDPPLQVNNVLRNRTHLRPPGEHVYDIGRRRNWEQVMGTHWWMWAVPLWGSDAPVGTENGFRYPRNDRDAAD